MEDNFNSNVIPQVKNSNKYKSAFFGLLFIDLLITGLLVIFVLNFLGLISLPFFQKFKVSDNKTELKLQQTQEDYIQLKKELETFKHRLKYYMHGGAEGLGEGQPITYDPVTWEFNSNFFETEGWMKGEYWSPVSNITSYRNEIYDDLGNKFNVTIFTYKLNETESEHVYGRFNHLTPYIRTDEFHTWVPIVDGVNSSYIENYDEQMESAIVYKNQNDITFIILEDRIFLEPDFSKPAFENTRDEIYYGYRASVFLTQHKTLNANPMFLEVSFHPSIDKENNNKAADLKVLQNFLDTISR